MEKKFDFKPFDKVLVKDDDPFSKWTPAFFKNVDYASDYPYTVINGDMYKCCIHYESNEYLLGTTKPYEPKYEPKKGDFVTISNNCFKWIGITKKKEDLVLLTFNYYNVIEKKLMPKGCFSTSAKIKQSSEEERQLLLDKMHEVGKDWDAEKMEIVGYKWMPKEGGTYFRPVFETATAIPVMRYWYKEDSYGQKCEKVGWVFQTEAECQALCDKLNEAIKNIK